MVKYICKKCNKEFTRKCDYVYHTYKRKNPCTQEEKDLLIQTKYKKINEPKEVIIANNEINFKCIDCNNYFSRKSNLLRHQKDYCKVINNIKENQKRIDDKIKENKKINICDLEINDDVKIILTKLLNQNIENNKLIEETNLQLKTVIDENNKIKKEFNILKSCLKNINDTKNNNILDKEIINNITINNQTITIRESDNYINATQLCKAGEKNLNEWFLLDKTKELINLLEQENKISNLVDNKLENEIYIHPDLAIYLSSCINPYFTLNINKLIESVNSKNNLKILAEQEIKINESNKKIKNLENMILKKQKREKYPDKYFIYLLTTDDHKKRNTYILGQAKNLTTRLGTYNKTCDHEVVYYKVCKNEEHMELCEKIILLMLEEYREVANRDRFILPNNKDISFFTDIIDKHCAF
jgi:hypothetical protein